MNEMIFVALMILGVPSMYLTIKAIVWLTERKEK